MKKENEVPALIELYHAMHLNQTGYYMLTLRTDNGRAEYDNHEADDFLSKVGIRHETSAPYTPAKNGTAERVNRTLLKSVRTMLISSGLPPSLWREAASYSVYIRNSVLSRTNNTTPYDIWNNRQPDILNIRIFESRIFIRDPTPSSKLEATVSYFVQNTSPIEKLPFDLDTILGLRTDVENRVQFNIRNLLVPFLQNSKLVSIISPPRGPTKSQTFHLINFLSHFIHHHSSFGPTNVVKFRSVRKIFLQSSSKSRAGNAAAERST